MCRRSAGSTGSSSVPSCSMKTRAGGGWRSRRPRTGAGARRVGSGPSGTAAAGSRCGTCRSPIGRWCWCGPSGCGAAPSRPARWGAGRRSPTRSLLERCSPSGPEPRSPAGSAWVSRPSPERRRPSGWAGTQRWPRCGITASPVSIIWPGWCSAGDRVGRDLVLRRHHHPSDPAGDRLTRERPRVAQSTRPSIGLTQGTSPRRGQVANRAVIGAWSEPVVVLVTFGLSLSDRRSGPVATLRPLCTLSTAARSAWEMRMWSMSSRRPR